MSGSSFYVERRNTTFDFEIIGHIEIPEVVLHAHICDSFLMHIDTAYTDLKEPLMLNEVIKDFKPESGLPPEISFTYLNDSRYRLNGFSITNKKYKKHDWYTLAMTP